jgi:Na+/proline symporter
VRRVREEAVALVRDATGDATYNDVNYVFPTFIVTRLPVGLVGLLLAAIFAAAMSTIAAELAALSTSTVIDFYRRWIRNDGDAAHLLRVSRAATMGWALFASGVAVWAAELGSLIDVVNRFGSFFYGSILGVFVLAIGWTRANATGAIAGLAAGMGAVGYFAAFTRVGFLWHNAIGTITVVAVGVLVSAVSGKSSHEGHEGHEGS